MPHEISIRIPSNIDIQNLDSGKFEKSTEKSGGQKITVLTYNNKPEKKGLEKIGQKISNFFSGIKNARNSLTAVYAWEAYGSKNLLVGVRSPRFNPGHIQKMATELEKLAQKKPDTLPEIITDNSEYIFSLQRTD